MPSGEHGIAGAILGCRTWGHPKCYHASAHHFMGVGGSRHSFHGNDKEQPCLAVL